MNIESRFSDAFGASPRLENSALWSGEHAVVLPTLGMVVPNWLLIVPRSHSFSVAQQAVEVRAEMTDLPVRIFNSIAKPGEDMVVFEHGAHRASSAIGCGIDHAHLHVIIGPSELIASVWSKMKEDLVAVSTNAELSSLYEQIDPGQSYYLAWRDGARIIEQPAREDVSQRFRRVVAAAAGAPDKWNYREHAFRENIAATVAALRGERVLAA